MSTASDDAKKSIRLTVKMPVNKLREATSGNKKKVAVNSRHVLEPAQILSGPRGSRAKRTIVEESDSEDVDDKDGDDEGEDEDEEDEDEVEEDEEDEEEDEDDDAEEDVDMNDAPPPAVVKPARAPPGPKPVVTVTPALEGKIKSVEAKETAAEDEDDDELSDLDSNEEQQEAETIEEIDMEDAEGEVDDGDEGDDGDLGDSDDEATPASGSRASTPDINKLTKRQRSRLDEVMNVDLLELPLGTVSSMPDRCRTALILCPAEAKQKKILSAEEHAMRRSEMARRRKNLSEKRNEEEKVRLLRPITQHCLTWTRITLPCASTRSEPSLTTSFHRWTRSTSSSRNKLQSKEAGERWRAPMATVHP